MSEAWLSPSIWLLRVGAGGGVVLLLTWAAVRVLRQPARRQRVAEWGVVAALALAALALAPSWLLIPVAVDSEPVAEAPNAAPPREEPVELAPAFPIGLLVAEPVGENAQDPPNPGVAPEARHAPFASESAPGTEPVRYPLAGLLVPGAVSLYLLGCLYFLARLGWGYLQLSRFLARTVPAPSDVEELFEELARDGPQARLLMASGLRGPLSCGLWRPVIVLPVGLCATGETQPLRWALAHELAHLRRRDAWTTLLFGLARAVYFFLPWFWSLRRQARLCQEYVADAAAVTAAGPVEEYAEFLLRWSTAPAVPAGATGVSGHSSDLYRRIAMLVSNPMPVEDRCPRRWSLLAAVALLSLSIVAAGVGLTRAATPAADVTKDDKKSDNKKDEEKKPEKKKDEEKKAGDDPLPGFPELDDLLKRLGGLDEETAKMIRQQMELNRKMLEQFRKQVPGAGGGLLPQLPGGGLLPLPRLNLNRLNRTPARDLMAEPRLGVRLEKPSLTLVDQLDLPRDQGLIVEEMKDDAAAAKAGLKKHDILLELDGKPVSSDPAEFSKQVRAIKPDEAIEAVVMRKSKKETIKGLKLPKMAEPRGKPAPFKFEFNFPNVPFGGNGQFNGNVGASAVSMTRTNDSFTVRAKEGDVTLSVSGQINVDKAEVAEIKVHDGENDSTYQSVDKVPEAYRVRVGELIKMAEGGKTRGLRLRR